MKILVINAGSSSLKYQLFDMTTGEVLAKGICEKIGIAAGSGSVTYKPANGAKFEKETPIPDHNAALSLVLDLLTDKEIGVVADIAEIEAVGHRFAHGGKIKESRILDEETLAYIESIVPINPLHGPPALKGVEACKALMPTVPQVGVFDSSFYGNMPEESYVYAIPYGWTEKYSIRRYGFHGTSHRYVSQKAAEYVGKPLSELKMVTCHIGSGSSVTAIKNGVAVDTSMGFTPQGGLPMGTRCGPIDPAIVTYMINQGLTADEVDNALNKKSGLIGVSGISSDARDVWAAADQGNHRAKLAMDLIVHYAKQLIGSYAAEMNGLDALVFTAGIGENQVNIRKLVCEDMSFLGIEIDNEKNENFTRGIPFDITKEGAKVATWIIPTDEEYMIAIDTQRLASK
jgi:acetate kinase